MKHQKLFIMGLVVALFATTVLHAEVSVSEFEAMKKEMTEMRTKMSGMKGAEAELTAVCDKCATCAAPAPGNNVTTAAGKLVMGGLVQVWYTTIQHDKQGIFNDPAGTGVFDSNAWANKDTFSVHTVELYFDMAITDKVSAFVYINPAAEIASNTRPVVTRRLANVSPEFNAVNGPFNGATTGAISALQNGSGAVPQLLQDALINFHDFVPHHDFTVGQMLNTFNEENFAPNNQLDFVDRSYIGNQVPRDTGAIIHGTWWGNGGGGSYAGGGDTGRLQYWAGIWNSAGTLYNPRGNTQDDNNDKDFIGTILLRPIWDDCLGKLELGYSFRGGRHGTVDPRAGAGTAGLPLSPNNSLERANNWAVGHDAWFKYFAPGCFKGLWFKAEGSWIKDRTSPGSVIDQVAVDFQGGDGSGFANGGAPFSSFGYWGAIGYKLGDSPLFCSSCHNWWKNLEIDGRYESAPNVFVTDPQDSGRADANARTNVYNTKVWTAGINYYIAGQGAKIQLNYNHLDSPDGPSSAPFHHLKANSLVVNFQVSW